MTNPENVFHYGLRAPGGEPTGHLLARDNVRIERIVSRGHRSAPGFWYDQTENEWVILLAGSAGVRFEGDAEPVRLVAGDYLNIPAHARHRVEWTDPDGDTVWLAVFYT